MTVREAREAVAEAAAARTPMGAAPQPMGREIGQSVYLMVLMGAMLSVYIGLGLLAVRLFG